MKVPFVAAAHWTAKAAGCRLIGLPEDTGVPLLKLVNRLLRTTE
jgi:hypothetical protein